MSTQRKFHRSRKRNPAGAGSIVLGLAVAGGLAYAGYEYVEAEKRREAKKKKPGNSTPPKGRLSGVYAENATLGNSPDVLAEIKIPIKIGATGPAMLRYRDDIKTYRDLSIQPGSVKANDKTPLDISWKDALSRLVTNLTAGATSAAWEIFLAESAQGNLSSVGADLDKAIIKALTSLAPNTDWSTGLAPYGLTSVEAYTWQGLTLLAGIAHQTWKNSQAKPGPTPKPVPDGWPADEEIPDNEISPEEQAIIDDMTKNLNGMIMAYSNGPVATKSQHIVDLLDGPQGFSAMMGIYSDDTTKATGQLLGLAFYTSQVKEAGFSFRSDTTAGTPNESARINALVDKLNTQLATIKKSI